MSEALKKALDALQLMYGCKMTLRDRAVVDAALAAIDAEAKPVVRMLTPREIELLREIRLHAQFGLNEGWQREARNLLLELEQYYRTIPPSGEIGGCDA